MDTYIQTVINKLLNILSDPNKWIKDAAAKTVNGIPTSTTSPDAYSFCLLGALENIGEYFAHYELAKKIRKLTPINFSPDIEDSSIIIQFNDSTTHEILLKTLKEIAQENHENP